MSREELVRKLDTTPLLVEGVRIFFRKVVLLVVLFFIAFALLNVTTYFMYQEIPNLTDSKENKEQAVFDFVSFNLGGGSPNVPISTLSEFILILVLFILMYAVIALVMGIVKGIAVNKTAKYYERKLEVIENERTSVDNIFKRLPHVVMVRGLFYFLFGFIPIFLMMSLGYLPNYLQNNVEFIRTNENLFILLTLVFFSLIILMLFFTIVYWGRYILSTYIIATNKDVTIRSSFSKARLYMQDDTGVFYGLIGIFGFIKFFINAYPMFMLFRSWAYPTGANATQLSLESVILIFLVFTPLNAIIEGIETATFTAGLVFLHRRNVSYTEMQVRVKQAVDDYDVKKSTTLDTSKMKWRQQKVGEMVVADEDEAEAEAGEKRDFIVCEHCGEKFFRQVNYDLHLSREHPDEAGIDTTEITCEYCGKKIIGKDTYQAHMNIFHAAKLKDKEGKE